MIFYDVDGLGDFDNVDDFVVLMMLTMLMMLTIAQQEIPFSKRSVDLVSSDKDKERLCCRFSSIIWPFSKTIHISQI